MAAPYRTLEQTGIPNVDLPLIGHVPGTGVPPLEGPQGADTNLWSPRPTEYRTKEIRRSIARDVKRQREESPPGHTLLRELLPGAFPGPTSAPAIIKSDREQEAKRRKAERRRQMSPGQRRAAEHRARSRGARRAAAKRSSSAGYGWSGGSSSSGGGYGW